MAPPPRLLPHEKRRRGAWIEHGRLSSLKSHEAHIERSLRCAQNNLLPLTMSCSTAADTYEILYNITALCESIFDQQVLILFTSMPPSTDSARDELNFNSRSTVSTPNTCNLLMRNQELSSSHQQSTVYCLRTSSATNESLVYRHRLRQQRLVDPHCPPCQ